MTSDWFTNLSSSLSQRRPCLPSAFDQWLQALAYALSKPREIAVLGDPDSVDTQSLLSVVRDGYRPFQVMASGTPGGRPSAVPLLLDRDLVDGQPAAYVCRNFTRHAPVTERAVLADLLEVDRGPML